MHRLPRCLRSFPTETMNSTILRKPWKEVAQEAVSEDEDEAEENLDFPYRGSTKMMNK